MDALDDSHYTAMELDPATDKSQEDVGTISVAEEPAGAQAAVGIFDTPLADTHTQLTTAEDVQLMTAAEDQPPSSQGLQPDVLPEAPSAEPHEGPISMATDVEDIAAAIGQDAMVDPITAAQNVDPLYSVPNLAVLPDIPLAQEPPAVPLLDRDAQLAVEPDAADALELDIATEHFDAAHAAAEEAALAADPDSVHITLEQSMAPGSAAMVQEHVHVDLKPATGSPHQGAGYTQPTPVMDSATDAPAPAGAGEQVLVHGQDTASEQNTTVPASAVALGGSHHQPDAPIDATPTTDANQAEEEGGNYADADTALMASVTTTSARDGAAAAAAAAANFANVRVGRVIAGPGESLPVDSEQQGAGPKYVTRVLSSPNKPAGPASQVQPAVDKLLSTSADTLAAPPPETLTHTHELAPASVPASQAAAVPVTVALPIHAPWAAAPHDSQTAAAVQHLSHEPGTEGSAEAQQALMDALDRARHIAYGPGPVGEGAPTATEDGQQAVLPAGTQATDAAAMQHVVLVSPDAMGTFAAMQAAGGVEGGEQSGVAPADAQQQHEMMMMMQQQWIAANGGTAVYMQVPAGTVLPDAMTAQQQQHWLKICNDEGVEVPAASNNAAAAAGVQAAVASSEALPAASDAQAASGSEAAKKVVVAGQKRPPWLDVCYNHTPPEPQGPFSPEGYVSPIPIANTDAAAPSSEAGAAPAPDAADDDPNQSARKWQKVRQGPVPRHRAVAVAVSPDAYNMQVENRVPDSEGAAAGQQPVAGQEVADMAQRQAVGGPPVEVQPMQVQQLAVYTVDGVPIDPAALAQAQAAGLTSPAGVAHAVTMVPAEEVTDTSALTSPVEASGMAVVGGQTPWIAIRAAPGAQQGQYVAAETAGQIQLPDGTVANLAEVGVAVCAAVGCGRRAEDHQQFCWKHLMELKAQEAPWQQQAMLVPAAQQLDNQRLEELATAALLPQDGDPQGLALASPSGTAPADSKALAKPRKRSRRRGALVVAGPPCAVPNCRREARPDSTEGFCSFHTPKRPRGRPDAPPCAEPECRKKARLCADGQMMYCLEHLQSRGLVPRAVSCGYPGCTKSSVPNMDGQRLYCTAHTRERGLRPRVVSCTVEGCSKVAQPSVDGQRLYCVSHMRQHGLTPKTGGCRHEGCTKVAKLATDGQLHFCIAHMRVNGLAPKVAGCSFAGCQKVAKASTNGQSLYCIAHMREHGLEPKVPACQHTGCPKVAKTSNDGQHLYCIAHMRERGLSPRMATCHHPGCTEFAAPATNKRCVYCKTHMPLYNLVPKDE